jgi:hypothetical protein
MSSVQTASRPRQNRTLSTILLAVGAAVLAAGIVVLVIKLTNGHSTSANHQATPLPKSAQPNIPSPQSQKDPHIKYSQLPADVRATVTKFVMTAVVRRNVASSWKIVTPGLRQGMSKKQWATGNIPPQPFPVYRFSHSAFTVKAKLPNEVAVRIQMMATPKSGLRATSFDIGVHKFGKPPHVHWKVDYWMPFMTTSLPAQNNGPGGA